MKKIDQILDSVYDRVIEPMVAKEQLLDLFAVSGSLQFFSNPRMPSQI